MTALRYAELRADGMSPGQIAAAARVGTLRRVARGAYTEALRPSLVDRLRALFLILPPGAAVAFHTAARLHGFGVVPHRLIHIAVPAGAGLPDIRGVRAHRAVLALGEAVEVAGLPCVPPERAAVDLARVCARPDALAVLDAALRTGACTRAGLAAELRRHDGLRGVRQARDLFSLADPAPDAS